MSAKSNHTKYYGAMSALTAGLVFFALSCENNSSNNNGNNTGAQTGNANNGKNVFRFETFGNEGFWSDAARLPQGITKARLTPAQAIQAGLSVNVDALDDATKKAVGDEIAAQGMSGPLMNSFDTTLKLLAANAVIGLVSVNGKVGVSCALCHAITDGSAYNAPQGGSIGKEIDGPAVHNIDIGNILALADNTRAFFPMAQLKQADGSSIGRASIALTKDSSEAEFDAYFSNKAAYPVGMFDDTADGNGNPVRNVPLFRQDLAAPFGSAGELGKLEHFSNTVYTLLFDPTDLLTPGGRAFLRKAAGAGGDQLATDYSEVLTATGVFPKGSAQAGQGGYPFVIARTEGEPGNGDSLIGLKVDDQKLVDMTAYVSSLHSPKGVVTDAIAVERGKSLFLSQTVGCTTCHNASQNVPVQNRIIDMKTIFPGDEPVILALRDPPASPIENTPGSTFDDKMIVINASLRGLQRGVAMPLLMDLARKPAFLHDSSVPTLNELFNPTRGPNAPHPFYLQSAAERDDLRQFLYSLDDTSI